MIPPQSHSRPVGSSLPSDVAASEDALIIAHRADGVILHVNDAFCALAGRPREEIVGRSAVDVGTSDAARVEWLTARLPAAGAPGHAHRRTFETPAGTRLYEATIHAMELAGEDVVATVLRDVTDIHGGVDMLGAVIDSAPIGVVVYDRDLRILLVNRAVERLGRISAKHVGMRLTDVAPDADPEVVPAIARVAETGEPRLNMPVAGAEDPAHSYLVNLFPIRGMGEDIELVGCVFFDDTERAAAERILGEFAAIVGSSNDAILSKTFDGTLRSWNAAAERLYGYTAEEAVGQPISIIVPEDRRQEADDILARIAAGERVDRHETVRRRKDGSLVNVSLTVSPIHDEAGAVVAASVIARDVTERRAAETRRSAVVEAALDAIVSMDGHGRIVEWNPAAAQMFGYTAEEAVGRRVENTIVPPDQRAAHRHGLARYLATGAGPLVGRQVEVTAMRAGGDEFPAEVAITPLKVAGELLFTAHIRDISRRREVERGLKESERHRREILASMLQAEEAERSRIATALHDDTVQVMTASLIAMDRVAIVAGRSENPRLGAAVALARATLEEATERTRRLMFELRPAVLHDHGLGAALRVLADQTARETGARAQVESSVGRYDYAVEELVYRSAQEALANVRKHAAPRTITVTLEDRAGLLVGEIRDDGCGFDVKDARSRPSAALHLGIDSLTERVRAAGGAVEIDSAPGSGTCVRITVPTAA
ncbi:MAG TPA: PAS domain S-box protein [Gaiellales bacterium]|nr:PAS domain S-box protein [Gaiellales bacterium]